VTFKENAAAKFKYFEIFQDLRQRNTTFSKQFKEAAPLFFSSQPPLIIATASLTWRPTGRLGRLNTPSREKFQCF
jgi:hypothetical protein